MEERKAQPSIFTRLGMDLCHHIRTFVGTAWVPMQFWVVIESTDILVLKLFDVIRGGRDPGLHPYDGHLRVRFGREQDLWRSMYQSDLIALLRGVCDDLNFNVKAWKITRNAYHSPMALDHLAVSADDTFADYEIHRAEHYLDNFPMILTSRIKEDALPKSEILYADEMSEARMEAWKGLLDLIVEQKYITS